MRHEQSPAIVADRYRMVRSIGKGGMGTVYEVEHLHTGQRLALKILDERRDLRVARFKREARALSRVASEHVVRVIDAGVAADLGGAPYLVMELLEGTDLERAAGAAGAGVADVVAWLRQVARGLDDIHAAGVVHRDIKPANLFLARGDGGAPRLKILDFGVSKLLAEDGALTGTNEFLGSPIYMAPEQADGRGAAVDGRADLYALGLVAFRLLVGRAYWRPGTLSQVFAQLLVEAMAPPSERGSRLGPAFDDWFLRACHRDPARRFSSAREQVDALAVALGAPAADAPPAARPRARDVAGASLRRAAARWLLVAAVVLAAAGTVQRLVRASHGAAASAGAAALQVPGAEPPPYAARVATDLRGGLGVRSRAVGAAGTLADTLSPSPLSLEARARARPRAALPAGARAVAPERADRVLVRRCALAPNARRAAGPPRAAARDPLDGQF
jgi:serine/threonine-protein kinase